MTLYSVFKTFTYSKEKQFIGSFTTMEAAKNYCEANRFGNRFEIATHETNPPEKATPNSVLYILS